MVHATLCVVCWGGGDGPRGDGCVCVGGDATPASRYHTPSSCSPPHFLSSPPPRPLFNHHPTPTMALTSRPTLRTVCRRASVRVCAKGDGKRVDRSSKSDVM